MENRDLIYHYAAKLKDFSQENHKLNLIVEDQEENTFAIMIALFRNGIIRMQLGREISVPEYDLVNHDYLIPTDNVIVRNTGESLEVECGGKTLVIGKNPFSFMINDEKGQTIYKENFNDVNSVGEGEDRIPPMGYTTDSLGNVIGTNICAALRYDEHIYGLGERFTEFDKRGQRIVLKNTDTLGCRDATSYKNIPFYISSYGYGLFLNTPLITEFDIGCRSTASISINAPQSSLEYYILTGDSLKEILSRYIQLTGPAALPPDWSFGLWYSTGFKGNSRESTLNDAERFRKEGIPCDVMHFDCYWMRDDMWCDFVWDEEFYPDRIEMLNILKEQGFKVCLWINPYVTIKTDMFREGKDKGYFVKQKDGSVYTADLWHGLLSYCAIVDFTNSEAVKWYQKKVGDVLKEGVDVLKTDFGEDIPYDCVFSNGKTGYEMRNIYSILYNKAVYNTIKEVKGEENALVWARSGCAGMQKFPVCWTGDPPSTYEGMASTLRGGLSLSMSGVLFWSHDMGGFYGKVTEEMFIRWSQFGLFSSHSRLHGTTTRQPWAYGERAQAIVTDFIKLRYKLMPYILKTAKKCVAESVPFLRPLVLEHPDDPVVKGIYDEYYFGDDILVAPVLGGHNAERQIYLPEGEWEDLFTKKKYKGREWYRITCPLDYMPVFIKNGAEIPMNTEDIYYIK
ncbi:MAG TPA: alpha-xylosidase [Clostridiaceae bacterium]|nr:alpha-xylosidase [Clostridiaceae bacterium]